MAEKTKKDEGISYKGYPLVRNGKMMYLGNPYDEYIAMLQIMSTKEECSMEIADKVAVRIVSTNNDLDMKERIFKSGDKVGLYPALDIAVIWLERALSGKK